MKNDPLSQEGLCRNPFIVKIENEILMVRHLSDQMTLDIAKEYYEEITRFTSRRTMPLLTDFRKVKKFEKEARAYLSQQDSQGMINAMALLIETNTQELVGNVFIYYYKLKIPAKIFTGEQEALTWLEEFKKV